MKKILCFIAIALMGMTILFAQTPHYEGIIYVTPTGAGTHSGDSWDNATSSIADAQALAQAHNAAVWVAAGIYYGDTTADHAFTMADGVNVYGGFAGNEPADYDLSLRDFETNETILDGDSARQVLRYEGGISELTLWDGFTIRNGYETDYWFGAGVYMGSNCIISHCKMTNNIGVSALMRWTTRSIISDCVIENNNGWGVGAAYCTNCQISNCQISNNTGGVAMSSHSVDSISFIGSNASDSLIITNCDISNNNGVGIYGCNLTIQNCRISNNMGTGIMEETGGGIVNGFTISHCVIDGNTNGGINAGSSTISDCQIYNNTATDQGGGIYANHCIISDCQIYNNTATFGGGIYGSGSAISNCRIYNNTTYTGDNDMGYTGGGIYCYDGSNSTINQCEISHNTAQWCGGVYGGSHISNCLISNNTGGGVQSGGSITSSTIVRNEGYGVRGAYYGEILNCIIWGNETDGDESNIDNDFYGSYFYDDNDINCRFSAIGGGIPGEGNIFLQNEGTLSPHFVKPALTAGAADTTSNVDWHLLPNSICINRGSNAAVVDSLDLDGTARIKRDTVDMGCYESDYEGISLSMPIVYVTSTGAGTHSGDSWENATSSINYAQDIAQACNGVVWVAAGIYYGDTLNYYGVDGSADAFIMKGVNVYGGFAGDEPADFDLSLRDFETNTTILDGQHARRVLYQPLVFDTLTVWDGLTIRNGIAGEFIFGVDQHGSTVWAGWYGGGACLNRNGCLRNCVITHNEFARFGTYYNDSDVFRMGGGGVFFNAGSILSNCLIVNNSSGSIGGGVCGTGSIYNSTIARNNASAGGAGCQGDEWREDTLTLSNCIVWGNGGGLNMNGDIIVSHSAIEGGYVGDNNITLADHPLFDPLFVNPSRIAGVSDTTSHPDWHLQNGSMCINRGSNNAVFEMTDIQGTSRIQQDTVDMGCYESQGFSSPLPPNLNYQGVVFVTPDGSGSRTGENWGNAASSLAFATTMAQMNEADVWVATGTYYGDTTSQNAFVAIAGVNVYGGLAGYEPIGFDLAQRNIEANPTILDGQNSRRVLCGTNPEQSVWDGFTITHGKAIADGASYSYSTGGGGVLFSMGGILRHCTICHNYSAGDGGGIFCSRNCRIENCLVANNSCTYRGGGIASYRYDTIVNTTITNNCSGGDGGGIWVCGGPTIITNCIIWGNVHDDEFYRNIVPDNIYECGNSISCSYSAIENGYQGSHNIPLVEGTLLQPMFVNPSASAGINDETANVDWHLQEGSICVNRGNNAAVTDLTDLSGEERNLRDTVDIGCLESDFYRSHVLFNEQSITSCDSCVWNDSVYYEDGIYTHTTNDINGYANVGVLHLLINHSVTTEVTVEAVNGYFWHGTTYTESGDYTWTGHSANGCDSIVTLHLTITTGIAEPQMVDWKLYPNPTSGTVTLQLTPETCPLYPEIQIFDIYGKRLQVMSVNGEMTQINLSQYAPGVYLIQMVGDGRVMGVRKVVKQ